MIIAIERVSDGQTHVVEELSPFTFVNLIKKKCRKYLDYKDGCYLVYRGKVLKSKHTLYHYNITQGAIIFMYNEKQLPASVLIEKSSDEE
jgi:hypothetical protein